MVIDVIGLLELVMVGAEFVDAVNELLALLPDGEEPDYADLTYEQKLALLKKSTSIIVKLGLDVNCYPLGYVTTILFNPDGTPVY